MAHWVMHPEEVAVFDANARYLDVSIRDLMQQLVSSGCGDGSYR